MSVSKTVDAEPNIISTCENHTHGDGRECEWTCDSEYYSTNTLDQNVTVK